jgi:hypothetical protein
LSSSLLRVVRLIEPSIFKGSKSCILCQISLVFVESGLKSCVLYLVPFLVVCFAMSSFQVIGLRSVVGNLLFVIGESGLASWVLPLVYYILPLLGGGKLALSLTLVLLWYYFATTLVRLCSYS